MAKFIEVEAWIIVDADENWVVAQDADDAATKYDEDVGSDASTARRTIRVTLKLPVPEVLELVAEVAAEPDAAELKVAG